MTNLSVFAFEKKEVRFVSTAEKPQWVASDVCAILEIKNVGDALADFDEDERGIASIYTRGDDNPYGQEMLTVTEPGLYRLIFKSRKPVAKRFQRWVFHEVLPAIRKTGSYSAVPTQPQLTDAKLVELTTMRSQLTQKIGTARQTLKALEHQQSLLNIEESRLYVMRNQQVGEEYLAHKQRLAEAKASVYLPKEGKTS